MNNDRKILILAGPNGAGKTTFATEFLPHEVHCLRFVNADLIAAGLSPFAPEQAAVQAGRLMLEQIHGYVRQGVSFAFETTLPCIGLWSMNGRSMTPAALFRYCLRKERIISHYPEFVRRLTNPDFRRAEVAMQRAAEKAQRQIREAGFEPVVRIPETTGKTNEEAKSVVHGAQNLPTLV